MIKENVQLQHQIPTPLSLTDLTYQLGVCSHHLLNKASRQHLSILYSEAVFPADSA